MEELSLQLKAFEAEFREAYQKLTVDQLNHQIAELRQKSQAADFWQNAEAAQTFMKQLAKLEERVRPWNDINQQLQEIQELAETGDNELVTDLQTQLEEARNAFGSLKNDLLLAGPFDDHDAIVGIHAGAGGTDAQDWAGMLLRMYTRWAEKNGFKVNLIDQSAGEEAGLKSATLEINGSFVYGKLKGEHGVHRLVRLSPFNADNLRQTSFAKIEVLPKIEQSNELELDEKELKIDVFRAGGHGGQSVNTTDSAVRVTHLPTGITVSIQNERSQLQNKETALTILRSRLAQLQLEQHTEKLEQLKGPNQSAEWGNQIRSYVLHPYKQVKDLRTKHESSDPDGVLDGNLNPFITAYLEQNLS